MSKCKIVFDDEYPLQLTINNEINCSYGEAVITRNDVSNKWNKRSTKSIDQQAVEFMCNASYDQGVKDASEQLAKIKAIFGI